jgi:hypothetical protein
MGDQDAGTGPSDGGAPSGMRFSNLTMWFHVFIPDHKVDGPPGFDCFLGDDRSFNSDTSSSSRVHATVTVTGIGTPDAKIDSSRVWSDPTRQVKCDTEELLNTGTAQPSGGFANFNSGGTYPDPVAGVHDLPNEHCAVLTLDIAASDPLVPAAPSVGVDLMFILDPVAGTVRVQGVTDHWPCFEGYASADGRAAVTLFQVTPAAGTSPYTLLEPRNLAVDVTAQLG